MVFRTVLHSGGLDSTALLWMVKKNMEGLDETLLSVSIDYGQRHDIELKHAEAICKELEVQHFVCPIPPAIFGHSVLLKSSNEAIPESSYEEQIKAKDTTPVTEVPYRNVLIPMVVDNWLRSNSQSPVSPSDVNMLYLGVHKGDADGANYPDCSDYVMNRLNDIVQHCSLGKTSVYTPFVLLTKGELIRHSGLPIEIANKTYSCYKGGDKPCGKCATCLEREKAIKEAYKL